MINATRPPTIGNTDSTFTGPLVDEPPALDWTLEDVATGTDGTRALQVSSSPQAPSAPPTCDFVL